MHLKALFVSQVFLLQLTFVTGCSQQMAYMSEPILSEPEPVVLLQDSEEFDTAALDFTVTPSPRANPTHDDIIDRIRTGMTFSREVPDHLVQKYLDWYQGNQTYIDRVLGRANRYLYHIVNEIESNDLPAELALLPIVESAFNPYAYSHSGAAGLWQFIPATAKHFGVRQDWWYEGRRDLVDSTAAAIAYLRYLHDLFDGDWLLALAAYNSGEGNVRKAIKKNQRRGKPTDFWSLSLPKETRAYVPQLIAIAKVMAKPGLYNLTLPAMANTPYFEAIPIAEQIDLAEAAKLAGIGVEEIYLLNSGYNRWVTPPTGSNRLLLPVASAEHFTTILEGAPPEQWRPQQHYLVKRGDTLGQIASNFRLSVTELKTLNNIEGNLIKTGMVLNIPGTGLNRPLPFQSAGQRYYKVRSGDSLWKIASIMRVSVTDLKRWNSLGDGSLIRPGQRLAVRGTPTKKAVRAPVVATGKDSVNHAVTKGDSLYAIAHRYNVRINDILAWNSIDRSDFLHPGQILKIYPD